MFARFLGLYLGVTFSNVQSWLTRTKCEIVEEAAGMCIIFELYRDPPSQKIGREIEQSEPQEAKLWWDWARNLVF